jgi:ankyrin repeat protein
MQIWQQTVFWALVLLLVGLSACSESQLGNFRLAVERGNTNVIVEFVKTGGDVNIPIPLARGKRGFERLIHVAARESDSDTLALLLRSGGDIDATNSFGVSALMHLVDLGPDARRKNNFLLLLQNGASLSLADHYGKDVLMRASMYGEDEYVALLLQAGANPNSQDKAGDTPLHLAKNGQVAEQLIAAGARLNVTNSRGQTAFQAAAINPSRRGVLEVLQKHRSE